MESQGCTQQPECAVLLRACFARVGGRHVVACENAFSRGMARAATRALVVPCQFRKTSRHQDSCAMRARTKWTAPPLVPAGDELACACLRSTLAHTALDRVPYCTFCAPRAIRAESDVSISCRQRRAAGTVAGAICSFHVDNVCCPKVTCPSIVGPPNMHRATLCH